MSKLLAYILCRTLNIHKWTIVSCKSFCGIYDRLTDVEKQKLSFADYSRLIHNIEHNRAPLADHRTIKNIKCARCGKEDNRVDLASDMVFYAVYNDSGSVINRIATPTVLGKLHEDALDKARKYIIPSLQNKSKERMSIQ